MSTGALIFYSFPGTRLPNLPSPTPVQVSRWAQDMVCGLDEPVTSGKQGAKEVPWQSSAPRKKVQLISLLLLL